MQKDKVAKIVDIEALDIEIPDAKTSKEDVVKWAVDRNIPINPRNHKDEILETIREAMNAVPTSDLDDIHEEAVRVMDNYDTDLIIQGIMGQVDVALKDAYIYEFNSGGKTVRGLTKTGVDEMSTLSADYLNIAYRIIPDSVQVEETDDSFKATVIVGRYQLRRVPESCGHCSHLIPFGGQVNDFLIDTMIGAARQEKRQKTRGGGVRENPFAYRVAISKAVRNAKLSLMSHEFKMRMMGYLLGEKAIKRLPPREGGEANVILLTSDSYISETDRRRLHAIAGKRGLGHDGIIKIIKEFGADSTNNILSSDLPEIIKKIEASGAEITISKELKEGLDICGYDEAWGLAQLQAGVAKTGDLKATEKAVLEYLSRMADKKAEEKS